MCNSSKILVINVVLSWKGSLVYLAIGHICQRKDCLDANVTDIKEISFILTKGTYPNHYATRDQPCS